MEQPVLQLLGPERSAGATWRPEQPRRDNGSSERVAPGLELELVPKLSDSFDRWTALAPEGPERIWFG